MSTEVRVARWRRTVVHPWTLTAVLLTAAALAGGTAVLVAAPVPLLAAWLVMAIAAGFAISGSV